MIDGHENDRPKMTAGREIAGQKIRVKRDCITMKCAVFVVVIYKHITLQCDCHYIIKVLLDLT